MFFLVAMSQVVGKPVIEETILRSGVPPHIGQSVEPGSDAERSSVAASKVESPANILSFMGVLNSRVTNRRPVVSDVSPCCLVIGTLRASGCVIVDLLRLAGISDQRAVKF